MMRTMRIWLVLFVLLASWTKASAGELEQHRVESAALGGERTIRIWKPAGDIAGVLYMHDAQNLFDPKAASFGVAWEVDEAMTALVADGTVPALLVVGIDHGGNNRIAELTMTRDARHGGGRGEQYESFLMDEVMPFVENTYAITHDPATTYVGGSSLGGIMSLELAMHHPDRFAGVIAMSPSLWWDNGHLQRSLEQDASALAAKRVWLDIGTREGGVGPGRAAAVRRTQDLAAALERQAVDVHVRVDDKNADHNEAAWQARFPDAVLFVAGDR